MSNKKISQFQEVLSVDDTSYIAVIQGNPYFNAVIKPEKFIETSGGMLSEDYVGTGATESVNNSDNLGNIPAEEYVTYTGATKNIDLNDKQLNNVNSISLNNTETIYWDEDENALSYSLPDGGSLSIGKEVFDYYTNIDTVPLVAGDVVSIHPINGNRKGIKRTDITNSNSVKNVIGMVTVPSIAVNNIGRVTKIGMVHELNTDAYSEGTQLYVSSTNPGKWTITPPNAPDYQVSVGSVVVKHQQVGVVDLHIDYNCKLEDLANVNGTTPVDGSLLVYNDNVFDFTKNINDLADKTDLQNHINAVNPHNITPEQLDVYTQDEVNTLLNNKSNIGHTHNDLYYTENEIDNKLINKSDIGHTHNDLYYTETEVNTLLNGKSNTGHTHDERYYTETEVDNKLNGKSNTVHTHSISDVTNLQNILDGKSNTGHTHPEYSLSPISLTYSQLYDLYSNSQLIAGQRYIINDYQTVYTVPETTEVVTGPVEQLIITALGTNKLNPMCYSLTWADDEIYYDIENNQSMVPACVKGYIYRRIDTKQNNDIGFDFRAVKFRRWQINITDTDTDGDDNFWTIGSVVKKTNTNEIYVKVGEGVGKFYNFLQWVRFSYDNLTYSSPVQTNWNIDGYRITIPVTTNYMDYCLFSTEPTINGICSQYTNIYNNKIVNNTSDIIANSNTVFFGTNINNNNISYFFKNNTIGDNFIGNNIGTNFYLNTIKSDFTYNTTNNNFYQNMTGNQMTKNIISEEFYGNVLLGLFMNNNTGNYFHYNIFKEVSFCIFNYTTSYNYIDDGFQYNDINNYFSENKIGLYFSNNFVGQSFQYNNIGNFSSNNIFGNFINSNNFNQIFIYNNIGDSFVGNITGQYFQYNKIDNNFNYNGGVDFTSATHVYQDYNTNLFTTQGYLQKLSYYNDSGVMVVVSPTS